MIFSLQHAKMLVCLVGRHKGGHIVRATKAAGARGGTIAFGRTVGDNPILQALSLAGMQQDIVFTLMDDAAASVIAAAKRAAREQPKKLQGCAVVMDVPGLITRAPGNAHHHNAPEREGDGRSSMESGYEAITVIINNGYADDVMTAARKAGATGGTILNARGTGTEEDVQFFGITLVPEKEIVLIIADREKAQGIVESISAVPQLNEPGGGILFTMKVEEFIMLGN